MSRRRRVATTAVLLLVVVVGVLALRPARKGARSERRRAWEAAIRRAGAAQTGEAAACSGPAAPTAPMPIPIGGYEVARGRASCARLIRCGVFGGDVASCLRWLEALDESSDASRDLEDAVLAGELVYDADLAGRAIAELEARPCDGPSSPWPDGIFRGRRRLGESCRDSKSCADHGSWCLGTRWYSTIFQKNLLLDSGRCTAVPTEEPRCDDNRACPDGLRCDPERRCVAPAAGEPCDVHNDRCPGSFFCDGTCRPSPGLGERCARPLPGRSPCQPWNHVYCGAENVCEPRRNFGEPCDRGPNPKEPWSSCLPPLVCAGDPDSRTGTCVPGRGEGEPCESSRECMTLECLDGTCREAIWPPWVPHDFRENAEDLYTRAARLLWW